MRLEVIVTLTSSAAGQTGGRVTGISISSGGNSGSVSSINEHNQFISRNGTNTWSGTIDFYWPSGTSKTFSASVKWATYSNYDYYNGCIDTWYMDVNGSGSKSNIQAIYNGTMYEDFYWGDGTTYINSDDDFSTKITASAWLDLIAKVNEVTGSNISTAGVYSDGTFYDYHYNDVANALGVSYTAVSKEKCTATMFNALRNAY